MGDTDARTRASRAMERLRLAEASLSRRRQTECGPSENARAAMRFILERSDSKEGVTPRAVAAHLGVSPAAVTGILDKLHAGRMVAFRQNPDDRRSKLIVPFDRSVDPDDIDPLTARVRDAAERLDPEIAQAVAEFLERVTETVDLECR